MDLYIQVHAKDFMNTGSKRNSCASFTGFGCSTWPPLPPPKAMSDDSVVVVLNWRPLGCWWWYSCCRRYCCCLICSCCCRAWACCWRCEHCCSSASVFKDASSLRSLQNRPHNVDAGHNQGWKSSYISITRLCGLLPPSPPSLSLSPCDTIT